MAKKTKKLKLKDTENVAALFADDLVKYFRMGGDMKNLTAKKVYAKLRGSDEKVYDHDDLLADMEQTKAHYKELFDKYPYVDDGRESRETVDIMYDFELTDDDHFYLIDKIGFDEDATKWTAEQQVQYVNEAMKLRGIREEDRYMYLKAVWHNTFEEVDFEEIIKDDSGDGKK